MSSGEQMLLNRSKLQDLRFRMQDSQNRHGAVIACAIFIACSSFSASCIHQRDQGQHISLKSFSTEERRLFLKGYPGDWRRDTDEHRGVRAPLTSKPVPQDARLLELATPQYRESGSMSFADTVIGRRSRRDYSKESISRDELGFVLWSAQGIILTAQNFSEDEKRVYRTAPSAGGRYPIEAYVVVNRVDDVPSGLYRYIHDKSRLLPIRASEAVGDAVHEACYRQDFIGDAAAVVIWTAIPYRTEWRYAYLAHRMIAIEAGHIGQSLLLAAEALSLGACPILAYDQGKMDTLLGVDGQDEFTIYMATIGQRKSE